MNKLGLKDFVIKYKMVLMIIFLFTFFVYGVKLMFYSISIDTEVIINDFDSQIMNWNSINRFSLMIIKGLLHLKPFNYYISNILMIIFFAMFTFYLYYIFYKNSKQQASNKKIILFSFMIISSLIFVEQFNFTLQCAEVAITLFIFSIALDIYFKYINSKKIYLLIISIILFAFTLGCYQSFMTLLIAMLIFYLVLNYQDKSKLKEYSFYLLSAFITIISSYLIYSFISSSVIRTFNLVSSNYLSNQILWLSKPFLTNLTNIFAYLGNVFLGYGPFYNVGYFLSFLIIVFNIKNNFQNKIYIIVNILCLLSPFMLGIFLGTAETIRAQFTLPIVISLILIFINNVKYERIINIVSIVIICTQTFLSVSFLYSDYIRYKHDVKFTNEIMDIANKKSVNKIVFIGQLEQYKDVKKGEVLGRSFFNWDNYEKTGINNRACGFIKTLDYNIECITTYEYNEAKNIVKEKNLSKYPNSNSIYINNDNLIINLSNDLVVNK